MKVLAYMLVLLSLEVLKCASLSKDHANDTQRLPTPPAVPSRTQTDPAPQTDGHKTSGAATLHGPNRCNSTIEYDGIVEETFRFTGKVRQPCKGDTVGTVTCIDGFYTTTGTGVGTRNVTRRMINTVTTCCFLYKEVQSMCVKDTTTLAVLISIPAVLVGIITLTCGVCCYCCCRRSQKQQKRYSKV
ncbi:uncharacterized protein LOC110446864 isoform X2 [Mizuhopecten yessoensis]|uniref:uncharacterized protein LOC110446864 isoform X2 n=1 Tax=Mizuhopecten yessoensis TaxID=6573 RepID=UPI000B4593A5|nr:uncharacterized protein LOC110446864 isoform X2 [Mizuhopecten yessoensis]XP_021347876.1 uncharacterized protein LOC110446864 isoform X2 [Mizuhopecten yessoensis]XP_021347877.1 uncharacterized protein LOC110446864 isoform X2 [Mizuhopecten yessoensis]XP_021347878.1 uncharacterized protein LOC110446864 isoform X2 [Mizuhopecten yessoensis]